MYVVFEQRLLSKRYAFLDENFILAQSIGTAIHLECNVHKWNGKIENGRATWVDLTIIS